MSPHERERLAAWMDGELPGDERREVETHLAECEECAVLLADMEAVDGVARELPLEAPPGYFEGFPARVRTRIEGTAGGGALRGGPGRRRLPSWTWAAAAALLLGVVTPLTLARLGRDGAPETAVRLGAPVTDAPAQTAAKAAAAPVAHPKPASPSGPVSGERKKTEVARGREETDAPQAGLALQAPAEGFASAPAPAAPAAGPPEKSDAPLASVQDALRRPALAEEDEARGEGSLEAEVVAFDDARPETAAPRRQAAVAGAAPPPEPRADAEELAGAASARDALAVPRLESRERRANTASGGQPEDVKAFGQLTRDDAEGAAAWRVRRESWRAFVADHRESPRLDEARVRVIEAGIEAWRAGGDPEDLSRAREDAEAYLAREDARQKERVRRALEAIGER